MGQSACFHRWGKQSHRRAYGADTKPRPPSPAGSASRPARTIDPNAAHPVSPLESRRSSPTYHTRAEEMLEEFTADGARKWNEWSERGGGVNKWSEREEGVN